MYLSQALLSLSDSSTGSGAVESMHEPASEWDRGDYQSGVQLQ